MAKRFAPIMIVSLALSGGAQAQGTYSPSALLSTAPLLFEPYTSFFSPTFRSQLKTDYELGDGAPHSLPKSQGDIPTNKPDTDTITFTIELPDPHSSFVVHQIHTPGSQKTQFFPLPRALPTNKNRSPTEYMRRLTAIAQALGSDATVIYNKDRHELRLIQKKMPHSISMPIPELMQQSSATLAENPSLPITLLTESLQILEMAISCDVEIPCFYGIFTSSEEGVYSFMPFADYLAPAILITVSSSIDAALTVILDTDYMLSFTTTENPKIVLVHNSTIYDEPTDGGSFSKGKKASKKESSSRKERAANHQNNAQSGGKEGKTITSNGRDDDDDDKRPNRQDLKKTLPSDGNVSQHIKKLHRLSQGMDLSEYLICAQDLLFQAEEKLQKLEEAETRLKAGNLSPQKTGEIQKLLQDEEAQKSEEPFQQEMKE